jgi:hypothetical protein
VYGFNLYVHIDLVPIPINERTSMDGVKKAKMMGKNFMTRFNLILGIRHQNMLNMLIKGEK